MMDFDAFISYSSKDKTAAHAACAVLESAGIRCWIAPRDIRPGGEYGAAIIDAIDHCRLMILIFSSSANDSHQIHREIERAVSKGVPIVPVRIEEVVPTKSMEYFLGAIHWLDALTLPLEKHLQQLAETVKAILQVDAAARDASFDDKARRQSAPNAVGEAQRFSPGTWSGGNQAKAAAERQPHAVPPPPQPFVGVPPRISGFTGRAEELDRLDAILMRDEPAAVTPVGRAAVQGMGGVGKTSLAVEYAYRFRNLYAGVCWCPAETRAGLLSSLAALAVTLGAATTEEADVEKAAKAALRRLSEQRTPWLLVYDNVSASDEIADLLPSSGARVLITSRFSDFSGWADEVALNVLPLEQGVSFLERRAGRNDPIGAQMLADELGRLPLALDHAAAYCKRTQMPFAVYAAKASSLIAVAPRGVGYPTSVATTFDLAITQAVAQCAAADALMAYLAQCAPERIPMMLVEGAIEDEGEGLQALAALVEVSLVKHDPFEDGTPSVTVHRLVQAVARAMSQSRGTAQRAVARMIARLVAIYPEDTYDNSQAWPRCAQLTPHLVAQRHNDLAGQLHDWPDLLDRAGEYSYGRASYEQAETLFKEALAIREKTLGPEHVATASSLTNLADLFWSLRNLPVARGLYERALAINEKVLGPQHPNTALSLNSLAGVLQGQGHLAAARSLFERAMSILEKVHPPEHTAIAQSLNDLAVLLRWEGDFSGARPLLERALAITEKVHGPEHPNTAWCLNSLAGVLQAQGELTGARLLLERALWIDEKALSSEHPNTNRLRRNLARLLIAIGKPADALAFAKTAFTTHEKALERDHPWTKDSAQVNAEALDALGRTEEAAELRERYGLTSLEKPTLP